MHAVARFAQAANDHARKIHLARQRHGDTGLFPQLAHGGSPQRFARTDPTRRQIVEHAGVSAFFQAAPRDPQAPVAAIAIDVHGSVLQAEGAEQTAFAARKLYPVFIEYGAQFVAPIGDPAARAEPLGQRLQPTAAHRATDARITQTQTHLGSFDLGEFAHQRHKIAAHPTPDGARNPQRHVVRNQ